MSEDTKRTVHAGQVWSALHDRELLGLGDETTAIDMAVSLQDQVRLKQHRVEELERLLTDIREEHGIETSALKLKLDRLGIKLAVSKREHHRDVELYRAVLALLPEAIDTFRHDATHVWGNGGLLRLLLVSDEQLSAPTLRELAERLGPTTDWEGCDIPPRSWPRTLALQGQVVIDRQMIIRGRRLLVCAYPLKLTGEAQVWAVVIRREVT